MITEEFFSYLLVVGERCIHRWTYPKMGNFNNLGGNLLTCTGGLRTSFGDLFLCYSHFTGSMMWYKSYLYITFLKWEATGIEDLEISRLSEDSRLMNCVCMGF